MAIPCNTEAFVSSVRRLAKVNTVDNGTFPTDSDIIGIANTELGAYLVPYILKVHEGHFIQSQDVPLVNGQSSYVMPSRAAGSNATFIQLLDSGGNPLIWPTLQQEDMEVILSNPTGWSMLGQRGWYFFEGNSVVLNASSFSTSASFIRFYFPQRVSQLVPTTSIAVITAVAQVGGTFTITTAAQPSTATFSTSTALEVVNATPSFAVTPVGTPSNIGGNVFTFAGTLPTTFAVGDSLCLQDQANFITWVPLEISLGLLDKWVAENIVAINGDSDQAGRIHNLVENAEKSCRIYLGKREQLGHRKVSAANSRIYGRKPPFVAK